jgi:hypothetical protein
MLREARKMDQNLGKQAKDKITGFEGIIIGKCAYLFGCEQYCIAPKAKENEVKDAHWFDMGRVEIIGNGVKPEDVSGETAGGINSIAPKTY